MKHVVNFGLTKGLSWTWLPATVPMTTVLDDIWIPGFGFIRNVGELTVAPAPGTVALPNSPATSA